MKNKNSNVSQINTISETFYNFNKPPKNVLTLNVQLYSCDPKVGEGGPQKVKCNAKHREQDGPVCE